MSDSGKSKPEVHRGLKRLTIKSPTGFEREPKKSPTERNAPDTGETASPGLSSSILDFSLEDKDTGAMAHEQGHSVNKGSVQIPVEM